MQETITTTPDNELPPSRPRRFRLIALGLVLTMFVPFAYIAYRNIADAISDPGPGSNSFPEPDFSLTDEEAIARFQELDEIRVRAYESADIGLVSEFAGPGPFKQKVVEELRQLKEEGITASPQLKTENMQVSLNSPSLITLRETVVMDIRFIDERGNDVTAKGKPERRVIDWTLEYADLGWLITRSVVVEAEPVD